MSAPGEVTNRNWDTLAGIISSLYTFLSQTDNTTVSAVMQRNNAYYSLTLWYCGWLYWPHVSVHVCAGLWFPTSGCCTVFLGTSLHFHSSLSSWSRMTTQTNGHVGVLDLRRPFSHTGPDDTTGKKEFTSKEEKDSQVRRAAHRPIKQSRLTERQRMEDDRESSVLTAVTNI